MNSSDKVAFTEVIEALAATFRIEITKPLLSGYWMGLEDLEFGQVARASAEAMRSLKFMPKVAEIRELIEGKAEDRAAVAWAVVVRAAGTHGAYHSVDFDDPATNAAVHNIGGWERVCTIDAEELERFVRRDFERAYRAFVVTGIGCTMGHMGLFDRQNGANGYATKELAVIACGLPALPHGSQRLIGNRPQAEADRKSISAVSARLGLPATQ